jgi:hypothetical protein
LPMGVTRAPIDSESYLSGVVSSARRVGVDSGLGTTPG